MLIMNARDVGLAACCICFLASAMYASPSHAQSSPARWGRCPLAVVHAPADAPEAQPATYKTVKLADNVYMFQSPYYTNTLIVVGRNGVLIADTYDDRHARLLKEEIAKITDKPVTKIVLSHEHFDHIGGTRQFAGAQIIAQKSILPFLMNDPLHRGPARIDTPFDSHLTIDMGTTKVELKYFGPTEGIANIVIYLPKEKMVLLSDLYGGDKELIDFLALSATNLVGVRRVLNEVSKWDLKYVLDAHTPNTGSERMRAYAGFLNDLYDAVYPLAKQANETVDLGELWNYTQSKWPDTIKLPKYEDWMHYDEEISSNVLWMASSILYNGL